MSEAPFAIYRHSKHKTAGTVAASSRHMTREANTPNADPKRRSLNRIIIGGDDPAADVAALVPSLESVDEQGRKRRRRNSVIAIEVLLTTSPEWHDAATPEEREAWVRESTEWLAREYGRDNIAHLRLHADERTPHLTGYIVPLDPMSGHLNARRWVGGPERCSQQQSDYAEAMKPFGLQRGVKGSKAKHERVKRHYAAIQEPLGGIEVDTPPRISLNPDKWAEEQAASIAQQVAPTLARARTANAERTRRKAAEATAEREKRTRERAEADRDAQKQQAARLRALPLPDVLTALGFAQDKTDPAKWRHPAGNLIGVGQGAKAGKWWDHHAQTGRGGAIDLVAYVMGTDFKGAVAWLSDAFGIEAAAADLTAQRRREAVREVKEAASERPPFTPPAPAPDHWEAVRGYLAGRGLPGSYLDRLHSTGDLYADANRNAVFICRNEAGTITGAELKGITARKDGTRFTGMAPGSQKRAGGFRVGDWTKATTVYLVESAIDAVSLFKLRHDAGERGHAVVSTAGTRADVPTFLARLGDAVRRVCGFDNDAPGDKAANGLRRLGWHRIRPTGKDWNDDLRATLTSTGTGGGRTIGGPSTLIKGIVESGRTSPETAPKPSSTPAPESDGPGF